MANEESQVVKEEVVQPTAPEATPEVKEESTDTQAEVAQEDTTNDTGEYSAKDLETDSKDEASPAEETTEPKLRGAEKRKQQLEGEIDDLKQQAGIDPNTEIRDLVSARNALKKQVEQANSQAYRPASENELLDQINPETGEYYTRAEAKVDALIQRQELQQYNERVAEEQLSIRTEAERAVRDFPMFDSQSPEYNPQLAGQVDQILGSSLKIDPNTGQVIGSNVSVYQLYKAFNDTYAASAAENQIKGQKATEKMLATADNVGGAPQTETTFDKLSVDEMRERLRAKGHDV